MKLTYVYPELSLVYILRGDIITSSGMDPADDIMYPAPGGWFEE